MTTTNYESGYERYVAIVRRRWPVLVATTLIVTIALAAPSLRKADQYSASAVAYLGQGGVAASITGAGTPAQVNPSAAAQTVGQLARTPTVVDRTLSAARVRMTRRAFLRTSAAIFVAPAGVDFLVTSGRSITARVLANAYARSALAYASQRNAAAISGALGRVDRAMSRLEATRRRNSDLYRALVDKREQLETMKAFVAGSNAVISPAETSTRIASTTIGTFARGIVLGLLLGLLLVFVLEAIDSRAHRSSEVSELLGLPLLGELSKGNDSGLPDAFRAIRAAVDVDRRQGNVVAVFEAAADVGAEASAVHLATAFARIGKSVALVDLDLRRPSDSLGEGPGVADVLEGRVSADEVFDNEGEPGRVQYLPAGVASGEPGDLVAAPGSAELLRRLSASYGVVVLAAPALDMPESREVLQAVNVAIVVVGLHRVDAKKLRRAREALSAAPATALGVVTWITPPATPPLDEALDSAVVSDTRVSSGEPQRFV